jgi:hypothetical protein
LQYLANISIKIVSIAKPASLKNKFQPYHNNMLSACQN